MFRKIRAAMGLSAQDTVSTVLILVREKSKEELPIDARIGYRPKGTLDDFARKMDQEHKAHGRFLRHSVDLAARQGGLQLD